MKIGPYVEKLNSSQEYTKFTKQYKDAFMMAGFFVLDFESGKNIHQIDYYIPSKKKVAAFTLDHGVTMQMLDTMHNNKVPEKLDIKTKVDLEALKGILEDEMKNRGITEEVKKIIASVFTDKGKKTWNLNCVLSGMSILRANVDDDSRTILKMEKSSIMDYIRKVSPEQLAKLKSQQAAQSQPASASKEDVEKELKKLDSIEKEIEAEKAELQKKLSSSKPAKAQKASKK